MVMAAEAAAPRPPTPHARHLARSCRILSLEVRLALAAGGWVEDEVGDVGAWCGSGRPDGACSSSAFAPPSAAHRAWARFPADSDEAEWEAVFSDGCGDAHTPTRGGWSGVPTTTTTTTTPTTASTEPALTRPPIAHAPWQLPGREAAWRARLARVQGGGGASPTPPGGNGVGRAAGASLPTPTSPAPLPRSVFARLAHTAGGSTRQQQEEEEEEEEETAAWPPFDSSIPRPPTPPQPDAQLRAGFDLAVQALLDFRALRWGGEQGGRGG